MTMATNFFQLFIRLLDHKTLTLQFPVRESPKFQSQFPTAQSIKQHLEILTKIPVDYQTLTLNGKSLSDDAPISPSLAFSTLTLTVPLHGGKGGFGSLLRGAVTKAGQKKTNNFDACRDMSGRRLRHVNAEKKLEEWKAEDEERRLEKKAEEYLRKVAKKASKGGGSDGAEKYVEKYRVQSEMCVKEVERSVRESVGELMVGKKKKLMEKLKAKKAEGADEKKLNVWMGKRKLPESESDDSDDDGDDDGGEDDDLGNEKSVIIDGGNLSDSSKEDKQSTGSFSVEQLGRESDAGGSSENGFEEENEMVAGTINYDDCADRKKEGSSNVVSSLESEEQIRIPEEKRCSFADPVISVSLPMEIETQGGLDHVPVEAAEDNRVALSENLTQDKGSEAELRLNFDDFGSAAALEVLGMERLKFELQSQGLKCGGTLQERAVRLFLLKTMPVDRLPKKLLVRK